MNALHSTFRDSKHAVTPATPLAGSVEHVADRLGVGRTTVYALIKEGHLASIKIGRRRLVPEMAVEEFLARKLAQAC
jgi:excisionase family DNA binding protein